VIWQSLVLKGLLDIRMEFSLASAKADAAVLFVVVARVEMLLRVIMNAKQPIGRTTAGSHFCFIIKKAEDGSGPLLLLVASRIFF
jgi:hypothetical protein